MSERANKGGQALAASTNTAVDNPRTLEMVAAEIRTFTASMLNSIIEIGRRMCEAKAMLPYGKFGEWIEANTCYSRSTANNYMRVYQEYGTLQGSLFGTTVENDQAFGKLNYTQALALLALPSGEREEFVETHDVEKMSTRELQNAIAERDAAIKKAAEAEKERDAARRDEAAAKKTITYVSERAEKDRNEAQKTLDALNEQIKSLSDDNGAMQGALVDLQNEKSELLERIKEMERQAAEAGGQPDQEAIDKAVAEAVEKANAAHAAEIAKLKASEEKKRKSLEKKVAEAEKNAKTAEEKAAAAGKDAAGEADALRAEADKLKEEAKRLRRELAMSGESTITFKLYFAAWQKDYEQMMDVLEKTDEDTASRLKAAINTQIKGWNNE